MYKFSIILIIFLCINSLSAQSNITAKFSYGYSNYIATNATTNKLAKNNGEWEKLPFYMLDVEYRLERKNISYVFGSRINHNAGGNHTFFEQLSGGYIGPKIGLLYQWKKVVFGMHYFSSFKYSKHGRIASIDGGLGKNKVVFYHEINPSISLDFYREFSLVLDYSIGLRNLYELLNTRLRIHYITVGIAYTFTISQSNK